MSWRTPCSSSNMTGVSAGTTWPWHRWFRLSRRLGNNPQKGGIPERSAAIPTSWIMFVQQAREEIEAISLRETPIYYEPSAYAMANEEMGPYWDSFRCNAACAKDVKEAIADHYNGYRLEKDAADAVIQKYGQERVFFILANTIKLMRDDGRVSRDNIQ